MNMDMTYIMMDNYINKLGMGKNDQELAKKYVMRI